MKQNIYHKLFTALSLFTALFSLVPAPVYAVTNVLYMTPSNTQMNIGTIFCVDIIGYAGADADPGTANGTLSFNSSLLAINSVLTNGKKCPDTQGNDTAPNYYSNRSVTTNTSSIDFNASQNQADGGVKYVFAVKFKAKTSGQATVKFTSDSKINNSQTTLNEAKYTINAPQPTSTPTPSPTPKASGSGSSTPTPTPVIKTPTDTKIKTPTNITKVPETTKDPTGLIDSVIAEPLYTTSTITWKVNAKNKKLVFKYGTEYGQLDKTAKITINSDGKYTATLSNLYPGLYYYFSIATSDNKTTDDNYSSSFVTNGYPITLAITENNIPVETAQVRIGEQSLSASNGMLSVGLAAGNYSATITTDTSTLNINFTVSDVSIPKDGNAPDPQRFGPFNLASAPLAGGPGSSFSIFSFIGVLAGGTILLAFGFIMFINYRRRKFETDTYMSSSPTSSIVVEDGYNWHQETKSTSTIEPQSTDQATTQSNNDIPSAHHSNSVHLTEEEPLDMFEQAGIHTSQTTIPMNPDDNETQHNPNSQDSTKP